MTEKSIETICPKNRQQWRQWLHENHGEKHIGNWRAGSSKTETKPVQMKEI
jgi:hypothetical protein